ncbi:MAG: HD-GYP domain-containing protein [Kangiellaceae bacterium]|nr:HD-GYP domain-containing protein [Kangiellaceae bacterium]
MIVEKDIARVSVGSYVVGIVKQKGGNKLKKQGWVRTLHNIEELIDAGVERVLIDTGKVLESKEDSSVVMPTTKTAKNQSSAKRKPKQSLAESIAKAKETFEKSKAIQRKVLDDIIAGRDIDLQPIQDITSETTEAVFENPDALACIINIREKDEYLLEHSTSVAILMSIFGRHLKIDIETAKQLAIGAFLHDVGKIKIAPEILNKPGRLTTEEFEVIKTHVNHSVKIIDGMKGIAKLSREVAAHHHEKLDGTGYPFNLNSDQIPQYSRMITICDIFDALTANRVYKNGMAHVKAFAILMDMAKNDLLDQKLVGSFIKCMGVYPIGSLVKLDSEHLAVVESRNSDDPIRPKVKVFYSTSQEHFLKAKNIDLALDEQKHIEKGVRAEDFNLDMKKVLEFILLEG